MRRKTLSIFVFLALTISVLSASEKAPVAVSPASDLGVAAVGESCPTFSWTAVEGAVGFRLEVFGTVSDMGLSYEEMASVSYPVLTKEIRGAATSWTPSSDQKLDNGGVYVWYVRSIDALGTGDWSVGRTFEVEIERWSPEMNAIIGESMKKNGVGEDIIQDVLKEIRSKAKDGREQRVNTEDGRSIVPGLFGVQGTEGDTYTFYGTGAGANHTSGINNTFIGAYAGWANTSYSHNTCLGYYAGANCNAGQYNTFLGEYAGRTNTSGNNNIFVGVSAGYNTDTGSLNVGVGNASGLNNTNGSYNTFIGHRAGYQNSSGNNNTYLGYYSGYLNSTGQGNVCMGYKAGYNETGSNKLYIDNSDTGDPLIYGEFDNDRVGVNGWFGVGTEAPSRPMHLQTTGLNGCFLLERTDGATNYMNATASFGNFGTVTNHPLGLTVNSLHRMVLWADNSVTLQSGASCTAGGVWTDASSRELKENIEGLTTEEAVDVLGNLDPVKYNYKADKADRHIGFIAEDVPDLVASKDRKGMSPMDVVAVLTKVVQEQQKLAEKQQKTIDALRLELNELKIQVSQEK
jgi:hypothetical protein